jgi:hypothetical protein
MLYASEIEKSGTAKAGRLFSLASWLRPPSYWTVVVYHFPLSLIAAVALVLPHCVTVKGLPQIPCTFLHLTGYPCPFCGVTRSFWAIALGRWGEAWANCPLAFAVYLLVAGIFLWHTSAMASGVVLSRGPLLRPKSGYRTTTVITMVVLLAMNWAYRISMGLDVQ